MKLSGGQWLAALLLAGGLSQIASLAAEPTAFELIKEGNRHVGEEAKGRVVQIRSEKSIGSLMPNIWYVVYYDPDATAKATEVKFAAGTKVSVKRPARILEPITRSHRELAKEKLKIDSDKAIQIAKSDPLLKNVTLTNTEMRLERGEGEQPVWKVKLWASKIRKPSETVHIGEIHISAEDGKVVKNDLKPGRVD
ncbi:MAG: hypothetical protein DME24_05920 [Verrucomicrobia bacterium]|nr:MAG: hypothetical protein DME24_05920 [Verrucomicrobiota bacterium]